MPWQICRAAEQDLMEFLQPGYGVLFLLSFSAATILPFGSEWLLWLMWSQQFAVVPTLVLATAGNTFGSYFNYALGYWAHEQLQRRGRLTGPGWQQAERWFQRYGVWSLLLAWLPLVGDPLTLLAGILKAPWQRVWWLILLSKSLRYGALYLIYFYI
ncbi:YqaA family protein [Bacterioplanoides pacificum]|uniref:YqaA family protein n=1 Tax=Bacterioplanoides pacificum TaxID=1171596 RepID=A0ABV7VSE4_9GAMM